MFDRRFLLLFALCSPFLRGCAHADPNPAAQPADTPSDAPAARTGTVDVNGVQYAYEIQGRGDPLLVLHGGLGSMDMFRSVAFPIFAERHEVIAVDLQGHGRSTLGDRPITLPDMGNDMATILEHLGYEQVDVFGYSLGGGVALRLAIQHPEVVRRLALASAAFAQHGFHPEMLPLQAQVGAPMVEAMKGTPMYESYVAVAPHPEDFPRLLDRMGEWMRTPYDWSADVRTLTMPVLLVYGDNDMFRLEHVVDFYHLLGGGLRDAGWNREHMPQNQLAILPNVTHYEMFLQPALANTVVTFLRGTPEPPRWDDTHMPPQ